MKQLIKIFPKFICFVSLLFMLIGIYQSAISQGIPELMYYQFNTTGAQTNLATSPVGTNPNSIVGTTLGIGTPALSNFALTGTGGVSTSNYLPTGWNTNLGTIEWTIGFWINNVPSSTTLYYLFGDAGNGFRFFINGTPGAGNGRLTGTGWPSVSVNGISGASNYLHFVRTLSPNQIKAYKNGVLMSTVSVTGAPPVGTGLRIGGYTSNAGLNGQFDEFRLYNRALSAAEISSTWNIPLIPDGCVAGTTTIAPSGNLCSGSTISLGLIGNSMGSGQTYQWQSALTASGPWANLGSASYSSNFVTSVSTTSYFQCLLTCSGNSQTSSPILVTIDPSFPGGNYTINSGLPTIGTNFQSFAAAADAIRCGINGPIVFDVVVGSGPYSEQITLGEIPGVSALNTITINGNGNTITSSGGTDYYTLRFNGADYVSINDLNIVSTGTIGAIALSMMNASDHNSFMNCNFSVPQSLNAAASSCVAFSSITAVVTGTGNNGNHNLFNNCTMNGGYYCISVHGNSSAHIVGNQFINCTISNFYIFGLFHVYGNNTIVRGCIIERPTKNNVLTGYGLILNEGSLGCLIENNRVRNMFGAALNAAHTCYAFYCSATGTLGNENRFINNIVSDIEGRGNLSGIYLNGATFVQAHHNTIVHNYTAATAGATYGIYSTGANGVSIQNNIISITRGGTGTKYGLYYGPLATTSNYNNVYINSAAGLNYFGYDGTTSTGYADLTTWQLGTNKDLSSVSANPIFNDPLIGNYQPSNVLLDNIGANLGITSDITGAPRSIPPDPGAYEFSISPIDAGVTAFLSPNSNGCYTSTENVEVTIKNFGSTTLDFSVTPLSVNVDVTGAATTSLTASPTGTLAPGATMNVIVSPALNMTTNGVYYFDAYTTIAGDGNLSNNNLTPGVSRNVAQVAGTVTSSIPIICVSATPTLSLSGHYGGSIQWQESTVGASGPWTNVGTGATTYIPTTAVTQTTWYQAEISCNGNTAYSNVLNVVVNNPQVLSTTPGSRCGIGTVTLGATANASNNLNWYANASGGSVLGTGNTFVTPTISTTTDFYVSASGGGGSGPYTAPMPSLGTPFSGNVRGFWFTAPSAFTITGLNVPLTGTTQSMAVVKFVPPVGPPSFSTVTNAFTVLYLIQNSTNTGVLPVNIPIAAGDVIGILGQIGTQSAYAATTGVYNTTINGQTVACTRMGMQFPLSTTAPQDLWQEITGAIGVVNITYTNECEGTRTPVTATINPSPAINVTTLNPTLCAGGNTDISVTSTNDPNYTYSWTSTPAGFTASGPGPHNVTPSFTTTYEVSAIDNTAGSFSGCANVGSVNVITAPALLAGTVSSSVGTICISGIPTLTVVGTAGGSIQWQESASATGPWTNVSTLNSTTYTPSTALTQTMYYQVEVCCQSTCIASNMVTVTVNNPQILSTTPGQVCGTSGTANLSATASAGADIKWYDVATGGTYLSTGNSFTTPVISSTTTYYAEPYYAKNSPIQLTEMDLGTNDQLEIQNVSPDTIDVTGWKVAISDHYFNINSVNSNVQVLSGIMIPGQTKSWTDSVTATNFWGSNMFWIPGAYSSFTGWAAILDNNNVLKDFVVWNWPSANIAAAAITIDTTIITIGSQWSGNGIDATTVAATNSLSRQGTSDNNSASDFSIIPLSVNSTNPGMTLPFTGFGCVGTRVPVNAVVGPCNTTLNLTCFIQGYWDGNSQMQPVLFNQGEPTTTGACDSIIVELHSDTAPYGIDATTTAVLNQNGTATCIFPPITGNKYIAVKHRSAVQTWSSAPVAMGTTISYNFSQAANMAFGDNQVEVSSSPSIWAFFNGDLNQEENIDLLDAAILENEISIFSSGYQAADLNGDGNVDLLDSPMLEANLNNFIYSIKP